MNISKKAKEIVDGMDMEALKAVFWMDLKTYKGIYIHPEVIQTRKEYGDKTADDLSKEIMGQVHELDLY